MPGWTSNAATVEAHIVHRFSPVRDPSRGRPNEAAAWVPKNRHSVMAAPHKTVSDNGIRHKLTSLSPAAANQLAATRHGHRRRRGEQLAGRAGRQSELVERVRHLQVGQASCTSVFFGPWGPVITCIGAWVPKVSSPRIRQEIAVPYANMNEPTRSSRRFFSRCPVEVTSKRAQHRPST